METNLKVNEGIKKEGFFSKFLNKIEVLGNKLPDPVTIFLGLCIIV